MNAIKGIQAEEHVYNLLGTTFLFKLVRNALKGTIDISPNILSRDSIKNSSHSYQPGLSLLSPALLCQIHRKLQWKRHRCPTLREYLP